MPPAAGTYWLYILELSNGHLYAGYARDVKRRFVEHTRGKGARATRMSRPRVLAACWRLRCTVGDVLRLERRVKDGGRRLKQRLVADPALLRAVVRRALLRVRVTVGDAAAVEQACREVLERPQARTTRSRPSRLAR
jgi:putative endonuclease